MTQRDPASYTAEELTDPSIDPEVLRHITFVRPDLWDAVLAHPNCYRELAAHIHQQRGEQPQTYSPPAEGQPQRQPNQHAQQTSAGAKTLAAGAKGYFNDTFVPATKKAAQTTNQRIGAHNAKAGVTPQPMWRFWAQIALPVVAFFGTIALFLPIASVSAFGFSQSFSYFHEEAPSGEGAIMLTGFILVILTGVAAIWLRTTWVRITAAVVAILAGLLSGINGFGTMAALGNEPMVSLGAGIVLLALIGIALIAAAVVTLLPAKKNTTPPAAAQY